MHPASPPNGGYADTAWTLDKKTILNMSHVLDHLVRTTTYKFEVGF